jgi:hypothetical protein
MLWTKFLMSLNTTRYRSAPPSVLELSALICTHWQTGTGKSLCSASGVSLKIALCRLVEERERRGKNKLQCTLSNLLSCLCFRHFEILCVVFENCHTDCDVFVLIRRGRGKENASTVKVFFVCVYLFWDTPPKLKTLALLPRNQALGTSSTIKSSFIKNHTIWLTQKLLRKLLRAMLWRIPKSP